jgi:adenylate cyclase
VEAATRETGDAMLLTAETRERLTRDVPLIPRGETEVKGRAESIELFAPGAAAETRPRAAAASRPA